MKREEMRSAVTHHDVAPFGGAGEARRYVGGGPGRGEGPVLGVRAAQLGGAHEGLPRVDPDVELDGREHARVLLVQRRRLLACPA